MSAVHIILGLAIIALSIGEAYYRHAEKRSSVKPPIS